MTLAGFSQRGINDIIGLISESADNGFKCKYRHRPDMKNTEAVFLACSQQHVVDVLASSKSRYLLCHSSSIADIFRQDQIH